METSLAGRQQVFGSGSAEIINAFLSALIADAEPEPVWAARAQALVTIMAPVLTWARDAKNVALTGQAMKTLLNLAVLIALAEHRTPDPADTAEVPSPDLTDLPEPLAGGIRQYLAELPGYRHGITPAPWSQARNIHGYALLALRWVLPFEAATGQGDLFPSVPGCPS